jgi:magnesium-transporting ATPase (P-type)
MSLGLVGMTLFVTLLLFSNISKEMNMYRFGWVCLMQLGITLLCVFQWGKDRFQNLVYPSLFDDPDFFAIIGLVIYLSVCSFYYLLYPYMIQFPNDNLLFYWVILPVAITLYGLFLSWGTWKQNKG